MIDMLLLGLAKLLMGWLIADFISGLLHWIEDRLLWVGMPLLSEAIVEPNRLHHSDPMAFVASGFWERNWTTWAVAVPIAALWLWWFDFSLILLGAFLAGLVVNEVHALAHRGNLPAPLRVLQQVGLIQSPTHHNGHHRGDHDRRYCILTDYCNPLLDTIGFWSGLEWMLTAIRLEPNRGTR